MINYHFPNPPELISHVLQCTAAPNVISAVQLSSMLSLQHTHVLLMDMSSLFNTSESDIDLYFPRAGLEYSNGLCRLCVLIENRRVNYSIILRTARLSLVMSGCGY